MSLEHRLSALLQLHLHSQLNTWLQWIGHRQLQDETRNVFNRWLGASYIRELAVVRMKTWDETPIPPKWSIHSNTIQIDSSYPFDKGILFVGMCDDFLSRRQQAIIHTTDGIKQIFMTWLQRVKVSAMLHWIYVIYVIFVWDIYPCWSLSYLVMVNNILIPASNADVYVP